MGLFLPGDDRRWASYDLETAEKLGLNEAIVLAHIIRSIEWHINHHETEKFFLEGRWWMYDSAPNIALKTALGIGVVKRSVKFLRELKILLSQQIEKMSGENHNWYSIDAQILAITLANPPLRSKMNRTPSVQNEPNLRSKMNRTSVQNEPNPSVQNEPVSLLSITKNSNIETNIAKSPLATVTPLKLKKPRTKKSKELKYTAEDLDLGKDWLAYAERETPWRKGSKTWTTEIFADGLAKIRDAVTINGEKLNNFGLRAILNFVNAHSFWASRCCSPIELLKITDKDSGRRKIDTVLSQMKPHTLRQEEKIKSWAPISEEEINNPFG